MELEGHWFTSTQFEIEPGEEDEINPGIYGRQLAVWLKLRLQEYGHQVEEIINEDWGRCLMCQRSPFLLWVGCANISDVNQVTGQDLRISKDSITWHCFATAEVNLLKRLLGKPDNAKAVSELNGVLQRILVSEPTITIVSEP